MTTVKMVSFFYLGRAESCRGLPITIDFLLLFCHLAVNKLIIGILVITARSEDIY
jgi:hypothetical protein